jgi:PAS domain S-box-containing protein
VTSEVTIDPETLPFRELLDAAADGILVTDQRGTIVLANAECERMFGYDRGELVGQPVHVLVPDEQRGVHPGHVERYHTAPRVREMGSGLELSGRRRDGSMFPVEISLSPMTHAGGRLVVAGIRDVTERRQIERELRKASAAKSEFLSSMSHELRTPLNAVIGFAQLLDRDRKQPLTERQRDRLQHVLRGGEHLLRLIDDVLDLARIEAGRIPISCEPVVLGDVLAEVVATLEPMAARAGIRLELAPAPPGLRRVVADRTRLAQILMNFGSNAIKYGRAGGHVRFEPALDGERARITVVDDGLGIPLDKQARLFEPFQRAGQEAGSIEGTGIGLAISKRLAELIGGGVGFTSEPGRGSAFWVEVAVAATADEPTRDRRDARVEPAVAAGETRHKVVYIEDNPSNIAFMREVMADLPGVELYTAPTAEIGIELVRAHRPAVVLMDINLPGMSGLEAVAQLRRWPETAAIPVVGLSAAALARDTARAAESGFYRYLTKPVDLTELLEVLDALLVNPPAG